MVYSLQSEVEHTIHSAPLGCQVSYTKEGEVEDVRARLRAAAERISPRDIAMQSGVSHTTIYRFIDPASDLAPNRPTLRALSAWLAEFEGRPVSHGTSVTGEPVEAVDYMPGPSLASLPERPRAVVLGYLDRFRRAGASEEELRLAEAHLASDRVRQFSTDRGILDEDKLIAIVDLTFNAMADLIAERLGRRP